MTDSQKISRVLGISEEEVVEMQRRTLWLGYYESLARERFGMPLTRMVVLRVRHHLEHSGQ